MENELGKDKATVRKFMRQHYTDARLVELLEHARSGKLSLFSCCCFIGTVTARHELRPTMDAYHAVSEPHLIEARLLDGALSAEFAFKSFGDHFNDAKRRRILIPIIKAEIRRRMQQSPAVEKANLKVEDEVCAK